MKLDNILAAITALGLGGSVGAIVTSIITSRSQKGKSRAEAADLLIGAAERVGQMNKMLDDENHKLRAELDGLIETVHRFLETRVTREELIEKLLRLR